MYTPVICSSFFFFFNDTATTEIYTLSLHDALPISEGILLGMPPAKLGLVYSHTGLRRFVASIGAPRTRELFLLGRNVDAQTRSEEHTSELQSRQYLVCRLLLEKKKNRTLRFILTY